MCKLTKQNNLLLKRLSWVKRNFVEGVFTICCEKHSYSFATNNPPLLYRHPPCASPSCFASTDKRGMLGSFHWVTPVSKWLLSPAGKSPQLTPVHTHIVCRNKRILCAQCICCCLSTHYPHLAGFSIEYFLRNSVGGKMQVGVAKGEARVQYQGNSGCVVCWLAGLVRCHRWPAASLLFQCGGDWRDLQPNGSVPHGRLFLAARGDLAR